MLYIFCESVLKKNQELTYSSPIGPGSVCQEVVGTESGSRVVEHLFFFF